jgi:hypothetical protein
MLIRITKNKEGIEHYLETGKKSGRDKTRDELDKRVHLKGDIHAFSEAVKYTQKNKKWKDNYFHLTASFAADNNDIDDETLRKITDDLLEYYFCDYDKNDLIVACEAHRPIIQSDKDKTTGYLNQRLLHLHLAVSMLDVTTNNQVRMIPFKFEADKAFQSWISEKYNLVDPANRKRDIKHTKKEIISRRNSNKEITHKQTKVSELRAIFKEVLADVESVDEAAEMLNRLDVVAGVEFKVHKSGNKYLQVKTSLDSRNINIRGKGFEYLEKMYYSPEELVDRNVEPVKMDTRTNEEIFNQHKIWWLTQQKKRKKKKKVDYEKIEKKYQNKFEKRIKEARIFYVLYENNIQEELIQGYKIWEKNNVRYLFNNDLNVKIYDNPNRITASIPSDPGERVKVVRLMLEMCLAKGWNLDTLNIRGTDQFKKDVLEQIKLIKFSDLEVRKPDESLSESKKLRMSAVSQEVINDKESDAKKKFSKDEIQAIKEDLNAEYVLDEVVKKYGVIPDFFTVVDNKINDTRTKARPKNVIDFLTKNCNVSFSNALPMLDKMLKNQQNMENLNDQFKRM